MARLLLRISFLGILLGAAALTVWLGVVRPATAQVLLDQPIELPSWFLPVWAQSQRAPMQASTQPGETPETIPRFMESENPSGRVATYQPAGATVTCGNAFFASLGTNGRTCFTAISRKAAGRWTRAWRRPYSTPQKAPILFLRPSMARIAPTLAPRQPRSKRKRPRRASCWTKGNIRVFIPVRAECRICGPHLERSVWLQTRAPNMVCRAGMLSMYRRVLNATNLTRNAQLGSDPGFDLAAGIDHVG